MAKQGLYTLDDELMGFIELKDTHLPIMKVGVIDHLDNLVKEFPIPKDALLMDNTETGLASRVKLALGLNDIGEVESTSIASQVSTIFAPYTPKKEEDPTDKEETDSDNKQTNPTDKIEKVYPNEVAKQIMQDIDLIVMSDTQTFCIYNNGIYEDIGGIGTAAPLRKLVRETFHNLYILKNPGQAEEDFEYFVGDKQVRETLTYIQDTTWTPREDVDKCYYNIVVNNGILNLKTGELRPHTPKEYHTVKLDIEYDPDKEITPEFKRFLETTFKGNEYQIDVIQEMFGYCLYRKYTQELFFMCYGTGEDGKTALLNGLRCMLGQDNISSTSLHDITHPRNDYALYGLYRKMANICGETGKSGIKDTSNLKIVTGRETIRSRDLRQSFIEYRNYAKLIFAMNHPPEIDDFSDAFKRRLVFIEFKNKFKKGNKETVESIEDTFTTPEGLTGMLTWAIEGLQRMLRNGKISHQDSHARKGQNYEMISRPFVYFVRECVVVHPETEISRDELMCEYTKFAALNNLPIPTRRTFKNDMEDAFTEECIRCSDARVGSQRGYKGITIKKTETEQTAVTEGEGRCTELINKDLLNFITTYYEDGVVNNAGEAAYNFGRKYPGHRQEFGTDYIIETIEKHAEQGTFTLNRY